MGEINSSIYGKFIIASLKAIAFKRGKNTFEEKNKIPVHLFIDEFQNYLTSSITTLMNEARKYKIHSFMFLGIQ